MGFSAEGTNKSPQITVYIVDAFINYKCSTYKKSISNVIFTIITKYWEKHTITSTSISNLYTTKQSNYTAALAR